MKDINGDLACIHCRYNLRALKLEGQCPECGNLIKDSIPTQPVDRRRESFAPIAEKIGYPVDAVLFVADAITFRDGADGDDPRRVADQAKQPIPERVCEWFRQYAHLYFDGPHEALELLHEWNIRGSEDVGAILHGLIAEGELPASSNVTLSDFDGLFRTSTLFEE